MNVWDAIEEQDYSRPNRRPWEGRPMESEGKSCVDCEHFRVGPMPNRRCSKNPRMFVYALGYSYKQEKAENGHTQAEKCARFQWASEITERPA
jgi:hypothetical protein